MKKKTTEEFVNDARVVHGDKYDYSETTYKGARENLIIICPIHGPFEQVAHVHLRGAGCEPCSYKDRGENRKMDFGTFLERPSQFIMTLMIIQSQKNSSLI